MNFTRPVHKSTTCTQRRNRDYGWRPYIFFPYPERWNKTGNYEVSLLTFYRGSWLYYKHLESAISLRNDMRKAWVLAIKFFFLRCIGVSDLLTFTATLISLTKTNPESVIKIGKRNSGNGVWERERFGHENDQWEIKFLFWTLITGIVVWWKWKL